MSKIHHKVFNIQYGPGSSGRGLPEALYFSLDSCLNPGSVKDALKQLISEYAFADPVDFDFSSGHELEEVDTFAISELLDCDVSQLKITPKTESISGFEDEIRDFEEVILSDSESEAGIQDICEVIKAGGHPCCIYVDQADPDRYILEGRKRLVAFKRLGLDDVTVAYCSVNGASNHSGVPGSTLEAQS